MGGAPRRSASEPARAPALPSRRTLLLSAAGLLAALSALYVLLPALTGLREDWVRVSGGDVPWLFAAASLELLSFAAYVVAFRCVCGGGAVPLSWRASYRITMAGVVATRLLAMAGAGGIALTAWALGRLGMRRREIAARMATLLVLLYGIYMAALLLGGLGLWSGALPGPSPPGLTLVPAAFGALVIALALAALRYARDLERVADQLARAHGGAARLGQGLATVPALLKVGTRESLALARARDPALLGALGWWAFDIAVLYASLRAFGGHVHPAVVVMGYFVGMLANTLPVPGGLGAVDGGMIGALIGFGVGASLAIVAVLTYRLFAFWLPIVPGAVAYVQLLRTPAP